MKAPLIARVLGIAFVVAAIAGALPFTLAPAGPTAEYIEIARGYGFLFGLFPVNGVHDALHGIFGIWGVAASFGFAASVRYCRWLSCIYVVLAIVGAIPITNTLFGIVPVYGHDIWLHAAIALVAAYGGFGAGSIAPAEPEMPLAPP